MSETRPRTLREGQLVQLTLNRFREFIREPEAVFWVFIFPILLTAGLGIAFRNKPTDHAYVAVVSAPGDTAGAALVRRLSDRKDLVLSQPSADSARELLRNGKIALIVEPAGGTLLYRFDSTRDESVAARLKFDDAAQRALGRSDAVAVSESHVTERGSRYVDFVVPGILGMNLMGSGVWGLGFALVDMRRKRLLKRFIATPMSRPKFMASFMLSRLVVLALEVTVLIGFAALVFKVPLSGPVIVLAGICLLGALSFAGLGLLLGSRARTVEGASGLMNAAMVPMWVVSGVFFSSSRFPAAVQPLVKALPLTALNDALRANMLQGASLAGVLPQVAVLAAWTIVCFALAVRLFRWQ